MVNIVFSGFKSVYIIPSSSNYYSYAVSYKNVLLINVIILFNKYIQCYNSFSLYVLISFKIENNIDNKFSPSHF